MMQQVELPIVSPVIWHATHQEAAVPTARTVLPLVVHVRMLQALAPEAGCVFVYVWPVRV